VICNAGTMNKKVILKISLLIIALLFSYKTYANPQGANVISGQVTLAHPSANALTITNSPNAIINWQSFDINANEITRFIQQNSTSAVLNRVVGNSLTASQIMGTLASNGKVFLINPNGIVFGANSVVDTAGLIASSLNLSDQDFLNNNLRFDGNASNGAIENKGYIKAGLNGDVFLIAPNIENSGIIETNGGHIILAAGEKVSLASFENENIIFQVQSADNKVTNLGSINTNGGAAELFAGTISHSGSINADSVFVDKQGHVVLAALNDITIETGSMITASGLEGGSVRIESELGDSIVKGAVKANGSSGEGGTINVLGERVGLFENALVSANGKTGGGEILIGGDFQGKNPDIKNAKQAVVGDDAIIKANATDTGDGGKVIVWADDFTEFHGAIEARGGEHSGNGGFVEVSGKETLVYRGEIDVSAESGDGGSILFDPKNITIASSTPDPLASNDQFSENATSDVTFNASTIVDLLDNPASVTLQANNDITVNEAITVSASGNGGDLKLQAGRDILINSSISTDGGAFTAVANSSVADGVVNSERDTGAAKIQVASAITTSGGDIHLEVSDGDGLTNNASGTLQVTGGVTVNSGGGDIYLINKNDSVVLDSTSTGATVTSDGGAAAGGDILIEAQDLDIQTGSSISAPGGTLGNLTIIPSASNQDIYIGTGGTGSPLEISLAELSRMTSIDTLTIGRTTNFGTLTIDENLTSADINASSLVLQHQFIESNNAIDLTGDGESLKLVAWDILYVKNAIDAGNVALEATVATFSPVTTVNIDSFTSIGAGAPTATFVGSGTTLFRNSTALNTVIQSAGVIDTSAGQTLTIGGNFNWIGGTIDGSVTANSVTTVTNTVTLNGLLNNNGAFTWSGGNINGSVGGGSGFNNNAGATFNATGNGTFSQILTNAGNLTKTSGTGTTTFNGGITINTGSVSANSGTIEFDGYTQTAGITNLNGGNITDTSGDGFDLNGGTLKGIGTITTNDLNINNGAILAPGTSPGTLNVVGDLNLAPTSTLQIELGGTTQGTNYDFVNVTGDVALNGTLNVSMFGSYPGIEGDQFNIISSGTNVMTGTFANSIFPTGYSISHGIIGGGAFYQLGLIDVPVTNAGTGSVNSQTDQILVLEENFYKLIIDDDIFPSSSNTEEQYDDQALICS